MNSFPQGRPDSNVVPAYMPESVSHQLPDLSIYSPESPQISSDTVADAAAYFSIASLLPDATQ